MYCDREDVRDLLPESELIMLTNDTGGADAPDWDVVDEAILKAETFIDNSLRKYYPVPFTQVPDEINSMCASLSLYFIYARRRSAKLPEGVKEMYDKQIKRLKDFQTGRAELDVGSPSERPIEILIESPDEVFPDDMLARM